MTCSTAINEEEDAEKPEFMTIYMQNVECLLHLGNLPVAKFKIAQLVDKKWAKRWQSSNEARQTKMWLSKNDNVCLYVFPAFQLD